MKTNPAKKTSKPIKAASAASRVWLQYHAPEAKRVCVAGTFNNWQPEAAMMQPQADGLWNLELELPPGTYEYRFVVDGCWCDDPHVTEKVSNPFGGCNAVLRVSTPA